MFLESESKRSLFSEIERSDLDMGIISDDFVLIRQPETAGEPTVITVNCPDKTGLGCDLCRIILFFGLSIVRGGEPLINHKKSWDLCLISCSKFWSLWGFWWGLDVSTDGKWCFILFWVVGRDSGAQPRWGLLKKRLLGACPAASSASGLYISYYRQQELLMMEHKPQVFLLKFSCYDRMGLLHGECLKFTHWN